MSPGEIVADWPHLTLADVHAALTYYHDHRDEIDRDLAEGDRLFEELKARQPSILEEARRRKADAADDPVPGAPSVGSASPRHSSMGALPCDDPAGWTAALA